MRRGTMPRCGRGLSGTPCNGTAARAGGVVGGCGQRPEARAEAGIFAGRSLDPESAAAVLVSINERKIEFPRLGQDLADAGQQRLAILYSGNGLVGAGEHRISAAEPRDFALGIDPFGHGSAVFPAAGIGVAFAARRCLLLFATRARNPLPQSGCAQ
ncbi:MAG: hypothetical protein ACK4N4_11350 [Burkholderiales bacterium]